MARSLLGLFLLWCAVHVTAQQVWTFAGPPAPGTVSALAAAASQPALIYLASPGGVWSDPGAVWKPLTDAAPTTLVSALAVTPSLELLAGTGDVNDGLPGIGILASADGDSWQALGAGVFNGLAITRVAFDAANTNHVLAAAVTVPGSPVGSQPGLYASADAGTTWSSLLPGQVWDFTWNPSTGVVVAATSAGLWRSTGAGFAALTSAALPTGIGRVALCAQPNGGLLALFADTSGNLLGLAQSTDAGADWQALFAPPALFSAAIAAHQPGGLYDITVAADPAVAAHFWVGGFDLWETQDNGLHWTNATAAAAGNAITGAFQHAAIVTSDGSLWLGDDGGVWQRPPGGNWSRVGTGLHNAAVLSAAVAPGGDLAVGTAGTGVAAGAAGAAQWPVSSADPLASIPALAADPVHPLDLYAALPHGADLLLSTNGGALWKSLAASGSASSGPLADASSAPATTPLAVDPGGSSTVYWGTVQIWQGTSGGSIWSPLPGSRVNGTVTALALSAENPQLLWEASSSGQLLRSSDGGQTFATVTPPAAGAIDALALAPSNPDQVWAGIASGATAGLWASENNGASWSRLSLPGGVTNISGVTNIAIDPVRPAIVAAAGPGLLSLSFNSGQSWAPASGIPSTPVTSLQFDAQENLWASTLGRGLWSTALAGSSIVTQFSPAPPMQTPAGSNLTLSVLVTALASPLPNATISWAASPGNWTAQSATNSQGIATVSYTAPNSSGTVLLTALASSGAAASASLQVTALPLSRLVTLNGANQSQVAGTVLAPITVQAQDSFSNAVAGSTVVFSDGGAGGAFSPASAVTDAQGDAVTDYQLPSTPATVSLSAVSGAASVAWKETAAPPPDFALALSAPAAPVVANQAVNLSVQVSPLAGYTGTVQLTCLAPAPCSVSPTSVAAGGTATVSWQSGSVSANSTSTVVSVQGTDTSRGLQHTASVTVQMAGFTLAAGAASLSVAPGDSAQTTALMLTPFNGFTGSANFSVALSGGGALPSNLGVSFTPNPLPFSGSPITAQLSVTASSTSAIPAGWSAPGRRILGLTLGLCLLCAFLGAPLLGRVRIAALATSALMLAGCGGAASPVVVLAPAPIAPVTAVYDLVINADSNGLLASTTVTVTVTGP